MLVNNINSKNFYKPQVYSQSNNISFGANLKITKEILLKPEEMKNVSFISEVYMRVLEHVAKLNGEYRTKFKESFPNMLAGEGKRGFVFNELVKDSDNRLQVVKLKAPEGDLFSLKVFNKEDKDLLTCNFNKEGKVTLSSTTEAVDELKFNPFNQDSETICVKFLSILTNKFKDLGIYSDNFTNISRALKDKMNVDAVRDMIVHLNRLQKSSGVKSELSELLKNYSELDSILKKGRSSNAVMYKKLYFGEDYDCQKGIRFKNIGKNGETYTYCPVKSKEDDRILRIVVQDSKDEVLNGFIFFEDGKVMKQVDIKGCKVDDFRPQNLRLLSDLEIKQLGIKDIFSDLNDNFTKFKDFISNRAVLKSEAKAKKLVEKEEKARIKKEKAELRKAEAEKRRANRIYKLRLPKKRMPVILNENGAPIEVATQYSSSFSRFNIPKFVSNLTELFNTPVEERSSHLMHEALPDGSLFKGRITMNTSDGAKLVVTKMKSPHYVNFGYYSVKVTKDGKTYVLNLDKEFSKILRSSKDGKLDIDHKHRLHYISKTEYSKDCEISEDLAKYLDELFEQRNDTERVVLSSNLKVANFSTQEQLLAQKEQDVLEALQKEVENLS